MKTENAMQMWCEKCQIPMILIEFEHDSEFVWYEFECSLCGNARLCSINLDAETHTREEDKQPFNSEVYDK